MQNGSKVKILPLEELAKNPHAMHKDGKFISLNMVPVEHLEKLQGTIYTITEYYGISYDHYTNEPHELFEINDHIPTENGYIYNGDMFAEEVKMINKSASDSLVDELTLNYPQVSSITIDRDTSFVVIYYNDGDLDCSTLCVPENKSYKTWYKVLASLIEEHISKMHDFKNL